MPDREQWLADTLVELADTLVVDFDLLALLRLLVERCAELLDAAEVGLVIRDDEAGGLAVMASSSDRMRDIELFEIQSDEGPCLDAVRTGTAIAVAHLEHEGRERWPRFADRALASGYHAVLALPLRLRETMLGAVNVFLETPTLPTPRDRQLAQALADVASISILQEQTLNRSVELAEQLQHALDSRIVLEQAKGMVAELLAIEVDEAFSVLRRHARDHNLKLSDLSREVVTRRVDPRRMRR